MSVRALVFVVALGLFVLSVFLLQRYGIGEVLLMQLAVVAALLLWLRRLRR
ncbi:MAG: hypothetical protein HYU88_06230 [Chloroflexi bacterium]|nr:hypothetical protein [Chloroflexota bacterium]MBI4505464.1 hypothetical protein [Chloroflexota bacterium]